MSRSLVLAFALAACGGAAPPVPAIALTPAAVEKQLVNVDERGVALRHHDAIERFCRAAPLNQMRVDSGT